MIALVRVTVRGEVEVGVVGQRKGGIGGGGDEGAGDAVAIPGAIVLAGEDLIFEIGDQAGFVERGGGLNDEGVIGEIELAGPGVGAARKGELRDFRGVGAREDEKFSRGEQAEASAAGNVGVERERGVCVGERDAQAVGGNDEWGVNDVVAGTLQ